MTPEVLLTLFVVPALGLVISNVTLYLKTRSDNATAVRKIEEARKADRDDADQKRRWDLEDRARIAADLKLTTASIHAAIVVGSSKADAAYSEANNINGKIIALQLLQAQTNALMATTAKTADDAVMAQRDRIEDTTIRTESAILDHDQWERGRAEANDNAAAISAASPPA